MDAHEMARLISDALNIAAVTADPDIFTDLPEEFEQLTAIHSYEEDGILTRDAGFVIHTESGEAYQVTVVRSR